MKLEIGTTNLILNENFQPIIAKDPYYYVLRKGKGIVFNRF